MNSTNYGDGMSIAMRWHLSSNFHPPFGDDWIEPALDAVAAVAVGDDDAPVSLPSGLVRPACAVVEALRLEDFWFEPCGRCGDTDRFDDAGDSVCSTCGTTRRTT